MLFVTLFREAFNHEAYEVHNVHEAAKLGYSLYQPQSKNYGIWFPMVMHSIPTPFNTVATVTYLGLAAGVNLHLQSTLANVDTKVLNMAEHLYAGPHMVNTQRLCNCFWRLEGWM
jgi:hypothetical protein